MGIKLLVACEDESQGLALSRSFAKEQANAIDSHVTEMARLPVAIYAARPDVLVLDHALCRDQPPHRALTTVRRLSPATRILLLCEACSPDLVVHFIRLGVSGYLLRSDHPTLLVKAVRLVHDGGTWFGRSALFQALQGLVGASPDARIPFDERLTSREEEILQLIGRGLANKEIARELEISGHTVKTHLHHIYAKLHQSGRYKAVLTQQNRVPVPGGL